MSLLGFQDTDRRVGAAELARAAQNFGTLGSSFDQADKVLPAAVKGQAHLNERLGVEIARLSGLAERLSPVSEARVDGCANAPRAAGLLGELDEAQNCTGQLITMLGHLNDHLEKLI